MQTPIHRVAGREWMFCALIALPATAMGNDLPAPRSAPRLPAAFIENAGQFDPAVRFQMSSAAMTAWFAPDRFLLDLQAKDASRSGCVLAFTFEGAAPTTQVDGSDELSTKFHYYRGNDPRRWADARGFQSLGYRDLYPGIDVAFRRVDGELEYDIIADRNSHTEDVVVRCDGADLLAIDDDGSLRIETAAGTMRQPPPRTMKLNPDGSRVPVDSRFKLLDAHRFGFEVDGATNDAIVIDPTLVYSTYLDGVVDEYGKAIEVDANGVATIVGLTQSSDFPTTVGAYDTSFNGNYDAILVRLNAAGSGLAYATFFGGTNDDRAFGVAFDSLGNTYVTGTTKSTNFPTTAGVFQTTLKGAADAYAAKFNSNGGLLFSTYLGGTNTESGHDITVDSLNRPVVTGGTFSIDFPTTAGAFSTTYGGTTTGVYGDGFVARLNATATALVSGTYLGGASDDETNHIAIDATDDAFVVGVGGSAFPTTVGAFDTTYNGGPADCFLARVNPAGGLVFSTFVGGGANDIANSVATVPEGGALFCGSTGSTDFPTTPGAWDTTFNGSTFDALVVKVDATGTSLVYATFLGGSQKDFGQAVATDGAGRAYVTGNSNSTNFPTTPGAWDTTANGANDLYVAKLDTAGATLQYSSFVGGTGEEFDYGIAVDPRGGVYFTGYTAGTYPTTVGAFDTTPKGANDAVVTKFDLCSGNFSTYGAGCVGSGGFTPSLSGSGCPAGGFDVTLTISQGLGGSTALLFFGLGQGTLPVIPTCALQVAPIIPQFTLAVPLFGAGPGGGAIPLTGAIPPEAFPFDVYMQALVGDPGANAGIASTNPLKMHIGP